MEIGPIPGIRPMLPVRPMATDIGLTDIFEIESTSRSGDETYTPTITRAASGIEDEEESVPEDSLDGDPRALTAGNSGRRPISYFA